jgi:hypothetical protein
MGLSPIAIVRARCCARIRAADRGILGGGHLLQQFGQRDKRGHAGNRRQANQPIRRSLEHPRGYDLLAVCRLAGKAAQKDRAVALLNAIMDVNVPAGPWMPRVKNLVLLGPVGVL